MQKMKIKIILNPSSGRQLIQRRLKDIVGRLILDYGITRIDVYQTTGGRDGEEEASRLQKGEYDLLIACGGDGTANEVVNGLMKSDSDTPLAILPAGTTNDFAYYHKLPVTAERFCRMVKNYKLKPFDVGLANDCYFLNVAAFGFMTNIAYTTPSDTKTVLGRLAYFAQTVKELPDQMPKTFPVRVIYDDGHSEDVDMLLCVVGNSTSVAGFRNVLPKARTSDGFFDVLFVTTDDLAQLIPILGRATMGDIDESKYIDKYVHHFKTNSISFQPLTETGIDVDLDGEQQGKLPLDIKVIPQGLRLLAP
jgi:diacylglycerol kinase (ATP)